MAPARFVGAVILAAIAGLIAITIYLVVERAIAEHLSPVLCLQQLLQWDASNAYGPKAFDGGWPMALAGLAMDCIVALCWAVVFTVLYVSFAAVRHNVVVSGLVFGAIVMLVMIFGVVPLGHAVHLQRTPAHVINVLVAHTIFFGLPVALAVQAASA
jgi:hypothetical protein